MHELFESKACAARGTDPVRAFPVEQAGPAHTSGTMKKFDPAAPTLEAGA